MNSTANVALDTAGLALCVGIVVSLLKPFLEATFLPVTAPLHNAVVRVVAILVGIVAGAIAVATAMNGWPTGPALIAAGGQGALAGITAIASYHLLTGGIWDDPSQSSGTVTTTTPVLPPAVPPAPPPVVLVPEPPAPIPVIETPAGDPAVAPQ